MSADRESAAELAPHDHQSLHNKATEPVGKFRLINFRDVTEPVGMDTGQKWTAALNRAHCERRIFITVRVSRAARRPAPAPPADC